MIFDLFFKQFFLFSLLWSLFFQQYCSHMLHAVVKMSNLYYRSTITRKISQSLLLLNWCITRTQTYKNVYIYQLHSHLKDTIKEGLRKRKGKQSAMPLIQTATLELKET